jgi:hypothetical protein
MPVAACPKCGYDTKGLPSNICPECGERLPDVPPQLRPDPAWRALWIAATLLATVAAAYLTTFLPGIPVWWAPMPLTVLIPALILESTTLAVVPIVAASVVLALPIALGRSRIPLWTAIPVLVISMVAWLWYLIRIPSALENQGIAYTVICWSLHGAFAAGMTTVWLLNLRRKRFTLLVAWHFLASIWLATYAFPYFGELL